MCRDKPALERFRIKAGTNARGVEEELTGRKLVYAAISKLELDEDLASLSDADVKDVSVGERAVVRGSSARERKVGCDVVEEGGEERGYSLGPERSLNEREGCPGRAVAMAKREENHCLGIWCVLPACKLVPKLDAVLSVQRAERGTPDELQDALHLRLLALGHLAPQGPRSERISEPMTSERRVAQRNAVCNAKSILVQLSRPPLAGLEDSSVVSSAGACGHSWKPPSG